MTILVDMEQQEKNAQRRGVAYRRPEKSVCIYQTDGQVIEAVPGLYAIKVGRGTPERALCVSKRASLWTIYLDGLPLSTASTEWKDAFGVIFRATPAFLYGRSVNTVEYRALVESRRIDRLNGVDLTKPINLHTQKVAI